MQGNGNAEAPAWVTDYQLHTSLDGSYWAPYHGDGEEQPVTFAANVDEEGVCANPLVVQPVARFVRLVPTAHQSASALRAELFTRDIGQPLGLESGAIADTQLR